MWLLELPKKLNIPCRNCMKTKEELEEAIKGTILKYKRVDYYPKGLITIDADTPVCMPCLKEL